MTDNENDNRMKSLSKRFQNGMAAKEDSEEQAKKGEQEPQEEQTPKTDKTDKEEQTERAEGTEEADKTDKAEDGEKEEKKDRPSTKDKTALTMYLNEETIKQEDYTFQTLNLEHQREFDQKLQKNANYWPAVFEAAHSHRTVREVLGLDGK